MIIGSVQVFPLKLRVVVPEHGKGGLVIVAHAHEGVHG